jgi:hypothetical protein
MTHVRQQIRDRIAVDLAAIPGFATSVYKMRRYPVDSAKLPVIAVYTVDENSSLVTIGLRTLRRVVNLGIEIVAKGPSTTIADTMDSYTVSVEEAIAADFTINGLAKSCVLTNSTIDVNVEGETAVGTARLVYSVEYITAIGDVETAR